jgi:hypothetical protein
MLAFVHLVCTTAICSHSHLTDSITVALCFGSQLEFYIIPPASQHPASDLDTTERVRFGPFDRDSNGVIYTVHYCLERQILDYSRHRSQSKRCSLRRPLQLRWDQ